MNSAPSSIRCAPRRMVRMRPPNRSAASRRVTETRCRTNSQAAASPAIPPPTMMTAFSISTLNPVHHDGIGQQHRVWNQKCFGFVLERRVAQINAHHASFQPGYHHLVSTSKRVIEENHNTGEDVREGIPKSES